MTKGATRIARDTLVVVIVYRKLCCMILFVLQKSILDALSFQILQFKVLPTVGEIFVTVGVAAPDQLKSQSLPPPNEHFVGTPFINTRT